ncbi:hypothetical protein Rhal01_02185 [Rubritalea halochordaticola]|uniref:Uncharacterized protein n=1 Tax=Rubritalea halochordaticola TaxID=714537 RepID=A0ABP9UZY6_9BACT
MKVLCVLWMFLALPLVSLGGEKLIPSGGEFMMGVYTHERGEALNVFTALMKKPGEELGDVRAAVNWRELPRGERRLSDAELKLVLNACDKARLGEEFRDFVQQRMPGGKQRYLLCEVKKEGNEWVVQLSCQDKNLVLDPEARKKLKHALSEAEMAKAWYWKLLESEKVPEETPELRRPVGTATYAEYDGGSVRVGGLGFRFALRGYSTEERPYTFDSRLEYGVKNGSMSGSLGGDHLLHLLISGRMELMQGRPYEKEWGAAILGEEYLVRGNVEKQSLSVAMSPAAFHGDRQIYKAHFTKQDLERIHELLNDCMDRLKWIRENEALFFKKRK